MESWDDGDVPPNILGEDPYLSISVEFHTHFKGLFGGGRMSIELLRIKFHLTFG